MKVTGIRLNNYLRKKDDKKCLRVTKIELPEKNDSKCCRINGIHIDEIEGIPLDDELLLNQCHFDVKRNISCIALALLLKDIDKFFIEDKFILIKEKGEFKLYLTSFSTEASHGVEEKKVRHLHQLQNVYYDITQEDLLVDLNFLISDSQL